jgi:hypothetical protein
MDCVDTLDYHSLVVGDLEAKRNTFKTGRMLHIEF